MQLATFKDSLSHSHPPPGIGECLTALWYEGRNNWEQAHSIVQDREDPDAALIHAYLHRREGDPSNAAYWYRRASEPMPGYSLEQEWETLVNRFLAKPEA